MLVVCAHYVFSERTFVQAHVIFVHVSDSVLVVYACCLLHVKYVCIYPGACYNCDVSNSVLLVCSHYVFSVRAFVQAHGIFVHVSDSVLVVCAMRSIAYQVCARSSRRMLFLCAFTTAC